MILIGYFIRMFTLFTPGSDLSFRGDLHKWEVVEFLLHVPLKPAEAMFSDAICENESSIR